MVYAALHFLGAFCKHSNCFDILSDVLSLSHLWTEIGVWFCLLFQASFWFLPRCCRPSQDMTFIVRGTTPMSKKNHRSTITKGQQKGLLLLQDHKADNMRIILRSLICANCFSAVEVTQRNRQVYMFNPRFTLASTRWLTVHFQCLCAMFGATISVTLELRFS